ncbi:hypothetical protein [Clostridium estertheticum]|uniref:hypothetical protein n=1 Tax=Clostridium estertheticum TaxID=238834 RepID=UPI001C7C9DE7|nr:hypothetical protein [Clostridium estertheticum]MBX4271988.1 hypothetical protein [Clostridium estertheticum]MCB2360840.1 hypothetical protein [Clostridium estertheticum]WLC82299.1 hypothetical protein KTC98_22775 [Clostridium estertheticum]
MNNIEAYNIANLNIKNISIVSNTKIISEKQDSKVEAASSDTIQINQKNKNIINTKKAYDAFKETCDEVGPVTCGGYFAENMSLDFNTMADIMKEHGLFVPDFILNGDNINNNNFLGFIDKLKDFTKDFSKENINLVPDNFYDFCDLFKEKLIQNGCT